MEWHYVNANGEQAGPVDDAGLNELLKSGQVTQETLVWRDGMPDWQPCRQARVPPVVRPQPVNDAPPKITRERIPVEIPTGVEEAVCSECGQIFLLKETVLVGENRMCLKCKKSK